MKTLPRVVVITVGIVGLLAGLLGLCLTGAMVYATLQNLELMTSPDVSAAELTRAFSVMSTICVMCYLVILVCSVDLIRQNLRWSGLLIGVLVFEVVYFFAVGAFWMHPTIGQSVAAATGIANGGLMFQFVILFPLWAPPALLWAKSQYA